MKEKEKSPHNEWAFYGSDFGGKVGGLLAFEKENVADVEVLRGKVIGASFFREFIKQNRFNDETWPDDISQTGKLPDELKKINHRVLSGLPSGTCIAIRSSVIGENEGVGVYSSFFMVTTGDMEADLDIMAKLELQIYADYFSYDSREFLGDKFLDLNVGGVGLLIQEVVGDRCGEFFMPAISGVATSINGELNLRLVLGLGTKAVEMKDAIVLKRDNLRQEVIKRALFCLREIEVISLTENKLVADLPEYDWKVMAIAQVSKLMKLVEAWQSLEVKGKPYYWEFAITTTHDHPQILQVNQEKPYDEKTTEPGLVTGRVMCESNDIVNIGTKIGRGIVHLNLNGITLEDLDYLHFFNQENRNYLLIIADTLFSSPNRRRGLGLGHFSNAAGVIEKQYVRDTGISINSDLLNHIDHGGTHFIEICKRKDILFQGVVVRPWDETLENALGPFGQRLGQFGGYWDLEFKMINANKRGRVEVYGETIQREYPREKLLLWIDELRDVAKLLESESENTAEAFYYLNSYLILAVGNSVADYDPYGFVDRLLPKTLQKLQADFDLIFQNIHLTESYAAYQEGLHYGMTEKDDNVFELKEYLQKLKQKIQSPYSTLNRNP